VLQPLRKQETHEKAKEEHDQHPKQSTPQAGQNAKRETGGLAHPRCSSDPKAEKDQRHKAERGERACLWSQVNEVFDDQIQHKDGSDDQPKDGPHLERYGYSGTCFHRQTYPNPSIHQEDDPTCQYPRSPSCFKDAGIPEKTEAHQAEVEKHPTQHDQPKSNVFLEESSHG